MTQRRKSSSGGRADQLSFLDPPPAECPVRSTPPLEAPPAPRGADTCPAVPIPSQTGASPPDGAFHAISFAGDRREAAEGLADAETRFAARYGAPARLIAVPAGEYDEYARLDPRVVPHPRLPARAIYLLVP